MSDRLSQAADLEPLVVKPKVAWKMLGCGNTRGYELLAAGRIEELQRRPLPKNYRRKHQSVRRSAARRCKFRGAGKMTGRAGCPSGSRRTTSNHRKIDAHASPTTPIKSAVPLRIMIEPTASGRKWIARLGERVLCVSASPFVKSARLLLAEGLPAAIVIEMWRPNTDESALQGRLGAVGRRSLTARRLRAAPRRALRRAIPRKVHSRELLVYVRPRAVLGANDDFGR